jgi:hypothetical protein
MCEFFASVGSISDIVMALGAVGAFLFAVRAWVISKHTLRHQVLDSFFREYRSHSMGVAVQKMYDLMRDSGNDTTKLVDNYVRAYENDKYSEENLHYKRRMVSAFYQQVAAFVEKDRMLKKLVYSIWRKGDLRIIPRILIPIETIAISKALNSPPVLREEDYPEAFKSMLQLYKDAPE